MDTVRNNESLRPEEVKVNSEKSKRMALEVSRYCKHTEGQPTKSPTKIGAPGHASDRDGNERPKLRRRHNTRKAA